MNLEQASRHGFAYMAALENAAMWHAVGSEIRREQWLSRADRILGKPAPVIPCGREQREMGETTKRRILEYLKRGPRSTGEVAKEVERSKAHTSELLRVMRDAGKVRSTKMDGPRGILWGLA